MRLRFLRRLGIKISFFLLPKLPSLHFQIFQNTQFITGKKKIPQIGDCCQTTNLSPFFGSSSPIGDPWLCSSQPVAYLAEIVVTLSPIRSNMPLLSHCHHQTRLLLLSPLQHAVSITQLILISISNRRLRNDFPSFLSFCLKKIKINFQCFRSFCF